MAGTAIWSGLGAANAYLATSLIPSGQPTGDVIDLGSVRKMLSLRVDYPSAVTGTAMRFRVSTDGTTWRYFRVNGAEYTIEASATYAVAIPADKLVNMFRYVQPQLTNNQTAVGGITLNFVGVEWNR